MITAGISLTSIELDSSALGSKIMTTDKYLVSLSSWNQFSSLVSASYYLAWNVETSSEIKEISSDYLEPFRSVVCLSVCPVFNVTKPHSVSMNARLYCFLI